MLTILTLTAGLAASVANPPRTSAEAPGQAERAKQAQNLADQAYLAYQREDWPRAIALYLESHKLVSTPDILYNVAVIYDRKLGDPQQALEYYRRHNAAPDANVELVAKGIRRISELTRAPPIAPAATPTPEAVAVKRAEPPSDPERRAYIVSGAVIGALGVVGVGIGIGYGIAAASGASSAHAAGCAHGACIDPASAALDKNAYRNGTASTIALFSGGALTVLGVTLILMAPKAKLHTAAMDIQFVPLFAKATVGLGVSASLF